MKNTLKAVIIITLASVSAAQAQITFDWNLGPGAATGTLTLASSSGTPGITGYEYAVTSMTGTVISGGNETGATVNLTPATSSELNFATSTVNSSSEPLYTAGTEVFFTVTQNSVPDDLELLGNGSSATIYNLSLQNSSSGLGFILSADVSPSPVPEMPLNPAVVAAAGLFIGWRSWRTVRVARA